MNLWTGIAMLAIAIMTATRFACASTLRESRWALSRA
jgi:hypothetical protein